MAARIALRLPPTLHAALTAAAEAERCSLNTYLNMVLEKELARKESAKDDRDPQHNNVSQ